MRMLAMAFALISLPVFACDSIPAEFKLKTLTGEFTSMFGAHTLKVELVDLNDSECTRDGASSRIASGATVTISNGSKDAQTYTSTLIYSNRAFYVAKPANMVGGGVEVNFLANGKVAMFFNGAAMKPTITR